MLKRLLSLFTSTSTPAPEDSRPLREVFHLPTTTLGDIRVRGRFKLSPVPVEVVDRAEQTLGCSFPPGYREYITRLGPGVLGGAFVRVHPPSRVVKDLPDFRERISECWLWDDGHPQLPEERILESIRIAETMNGAELIFHPSDPTRLYCLARGGPDVHAAGRHLLEAVDWLCSAGVITRAFIERNFEPDHG